MTLVIEEAAIGQLDEVEHLWVDLHRHHRRVAPEQPFVIDDAVSWQRRAALYRDGLGAGTAFLLVAREAGTPVGYAFVVLEHGSDDTFELGERYAELYSLSVAEGARGRGIGSRLFDAVEHELHARGIEGLKVAVMIGNDDAQRFYERRGLAPAELVLYRTGA